MSTLGATWATLPRARLLVLGDLMLDRYVGGEAERVSPEAPVLVLRAETHDVRPGGAANVAAFLRGLEAEVTLIGVVGDDGDGRTLRKLLQELGVDAGGVLALDDRPTTSKQRFVGRTAQRQPHQLLRVDWETRTPLLASVQQTLLAAFTAALPDCAAVLISDYGKGVCSHEVLRAVIDRSRQAGVPVLIDPCRDVDYRRYAGASLLAPNRVAAEQVCGRTLRDPDVILAAAAEFRTRLQLDAAVFTLDRDGLAYATADSRRLVPCRPRAVADVTGAGDMVLSLLGLCAASGVPLVESLELANVAAGLEVERFGVELITRCEIAAELHSGTSGSATALESLLPQVAAHRRAGRGVVFTNGCFDLLHVGHVQLLQEAATLGDVLIVAINSDASVRKLKGPDRPVIGEQDRARLLAALGCVDHVLIFDDDTPHRLLEAIRPDVLVKGGTTGEIVARDVVEAYGGRVCRLRTTEGVSTTRLLAGLRLAPPIRQPEGAVP